MLKQLNSFKHVALLAAASLLLICSSTFAASYYASPTGTGNGLSQSSPFKVAQFWPLARPGDALHLLDGTYTDTISAPATFAGTANQPITIRALNDGKVLFDGQYSRRPVNLDGSYGILEGINIRQGSDSNIAFRGTRWIARRIVSWDIHDVAGSNVSMGGMYNTLEDCAVFGKSRKQIACGAAKQGQSYNTVRRCWARWETKSAAGGSGPTETMEMGYGQDNVTFENVIATRDVMSPGYVSEPEAPLKLFRTQNSRILGSISYLAGHENFDTSTLFAGYTDGGSHYAGGNHHPTTNALIRHVVSYASPSHPKFANIKPFNFTQHTGSPGVNNRVENSVGIGGADSYFHASSWQYSNVRTGRTIAEAIGAGKSIWNEVPGIYYRYVDGQLTSQPLWPWPMNQRIIDTLKQAGYTGADVVDVNGTMQTLFGPFPAPTTHTLNVSTGGTGSGTVTRNPNAASYASGAIVTLRATAASGSTFAGWSGAVTGAANPITVTMNSNKSVTATFNPLPAVKTFYVAKTGSDSNSGTSAAPFLTINRGVSALAGGDTLIIRAGTYDEKITDVSSVSSPVPAGVSWQKPTTIKAEVRRTVTLRPTTAYPGGGGVVSLLSHTTQYVHIEGLVVDAGYINACVYLSGPSRIRVKDCELHRSRTNGINSFRDDLKRGTGNEFIGLDVHHAGDNVDFTKVAPPYAHGMYMTTDFSLVEHCRFWHCAHAGIQVYDSKFGLANNNIIRFNMCFENGVSKTRGEGIVCGAGAGNKIYGNIVYDNPSGIILYGHAEVYNNTIFSNITGSKDHIGIFVGIVSGASIKNNICYGHGNLDILDSGSGTTIGNNLKTSQLPNLAQTFVDAANRNFHLVAGSPATDAGVALPIVTHDIDGNSRPQGAAFDIGAYELVATQPTYALTVVTNGSGTGTVAKNPNASSYASGSIVTLTATPGGGSTFAGWSGAFTGTTNPITVTMTGNKSVTATFNTVPAPTFTLSISTSGTGSGTVVKNPNAAGYASGTVVTLTATPASGSMFIGWSGAVTGTTNPIAVTMNANKAVTATFTRSNRAPQIVSSPWADPSAITLPSTTTVNVLASDPDGDALMYTWSKVSGPGNVSFSPNATIASKTSTASFSVAGLYVLRVAVSDASSQVTGDVTVQVNPPVVSNLLTNGDVELGIWENNKYSGTNPERTWATDFSHSPSHSLKMTSASYFYGYFTSSAVNVTAGKNYDLAMWVKTVSITNGVTLNIFWYDANGVLLGWTPEAGGKVTGTNGWKQIRGPVTARSNAKTAKVHIRVESTGGAAWIDDISMREVMALAAEVSSFDGEMPDENTAGETGTDGGAGTPPNTLELKIETLKGSMKFNREGNDAFAITGVLSDIPAGFDPTGMPITINLSGAEVSLTLDEKGRARSNFGNIALKFKGKRDKTTKRIAFAGGPVTITANLKGGTWSRAWAEVGMNADVTNQKTAMTLAVMITLGDQVHTSSAQVAYSSKAGVSGKFK